MERLARHAVTRLLVGDDRDALVALDSRLHCTPLALANRSVADELAAIAIYGNAAAAKKQQHAAITAKFGEAVLDLLREGTGKILQ